MTPNVKGETKKTNNVVKPGKDKIILRRRCHKLFDSLWKDRTKRRIKREEAYEWLAERLDIPIEECHFSTLSKKKLRETLKILSGMKERHSLQK